MKLLSLFVIAMAAVSAWGQAITGTTINATTGFRNNGVAPNGYFLAGNGTNFISALPGLLSSVNSPVMTSPYQISCASSGIVDDASVLEFAASGTTSAALVDLPSTSANLGCVVTLLVDNTSNGITLTPSGGDLINVWTGAQYFASQASYVLTNGQFATINAGTPGYWALRVSQFPYSLFGAGSSALYVTRVAGGNFSCSTGCGSPAAISGTGYALAVTVPPSPAVNLSFSCDLAFSVADVSGEPVVNFYIQDTGVNGSPPSFKIGTAMGTIGTSVSSVLDFAFVFAKTSPRPIFLVGSPPQSDTQPHHLHIAGGVEQNVSIAPNIIQLMVSTSASTVTVYRNSICQWQENAY